MCTRHPAKGFSVDVADPLFLKEMPLPAFAETDDLSVRSPVDANLGKAGRYPLPVAQYLRLRTHIPALYALLSLNAAILAYTHYGIAPPLLSVTLPSILILLGMLRMVTWLRPIRRVELEVDWVTRKLRQTTVLAVAMALGYLGWGISLDQYGGPYEHGHVAAFVAVTVLGCVFCLSYLPQAAVIVCMLVMGIFTAYSALNGNEVMLAIAVNIALVVVVILKILRDSFDAFVKLETAQRALQAERRQAQSLGEENAHLAQTDALTGLPNRRYFFAMLEAMLDLEGERTPFCVGLIDLDRFKPINDTHGHAQGDRLLQIIGERMLERCPEDVIVARLGGDEFGLIVLGDLDKAEAAGRLLCAEICQPARLGEVVVSVGCSAGLAAYPQAAQTAHALFDRADFALYHAKNHKRGQCVRFSKELESLIRSEQALDAALQTANLDREMSVVYQPIVATADLAMIGVECLARWNSPSLGQVSPELLISTAERLGRAREVTLTLFDKALVALARLPSSLRMTFNLSGHDLCDAATIAGLLERIEDAQCDSRRLLFEITETSLISEIEAASAALARLRNAGARIALDDFGTGYSSLSSLHQLPLDMVKIDRSFAPRLDEVSGRRLITAIRNLARSLSLECVIEGIETENQLISARLAGFSLAQGFYMARPMPIEHILARIDGEAGEETEFWSAA